MVSIIYRNFWTKRIEDAWKKRTVIWLSGVRRTGKTFLCRSLKNIEYFDCELPRTRMMLESPEDFLMEMKNRTVVLDEIHRLGNPSELLKIVADHFPLVKIIATGSSTLGASRKFRDTLTGRKTELWLTPMLLQDMEDFKNEDLRHRLLRGGLPSFFRSDELPEKDFQEWMDAYWAKDIQELFRIERRYSFQKFTELLSIQSGGIFEASKFAARCEVSRSTITNYLGVLEATFVVHVLRPFNTRKQTEIVASPKVYFFDTGFVCYYRGWLDLRTQDLGGLWEHFVLNQIHGELQTRDIYYWRNKQKQEVDFIIKIRGREPIALECKWSANDFEPSGLTAFRKLYPKGKNFIVLPSFERSYVRTYGDVKVEFLSLPELISRIRTETR